jgi:hypothetical protein
MADSATRFTPAEVSTYYAARVPSLKLQGKHSRGRCPVHNGKDDNFAVNLESGAAYCHSVCGRGWDMIGLEQAITGADFRTAKKAVFHLMGRVEPDPPRSRKNGNPASPLPTKPTKPSAAAVNWREVERYPYVNRDEQLVFDVIRYVNADGSKAFRQCRPSGRGGFIWNLEGVERVPYRLPKLLRAETVYLPEGEKDVHTLEGWALTASCNPGGSASSYLYAEWSEYFRNRHVVILPDNDGPGRKHAAAVARALLSVAASVRIVELPGLPAKGDVTDWREAGGTREQFCDIVNAAAPIDATNILELLARWGLATDESNNAGRPESEEDWPKPEPIRRDLPPVDAFNEELLPTSFRALVRDVAERMQVPMDFPAVIMVLCLAGVVNRRAVIQPKEHDGSWITVPNLWGGLIAPPGFMKSPVIQAATRPLTQIQNGWWCEHDEALKEYARTKEEHELRRAVWKEEYKKHAKRGTTPPGRPDDEPSEPKLQRLIVNDATFEALHRTMSENPAGILLIRDELTGWLARLDCEEYGDERAFALQAWNGDAAYTVDRISRGTIHVEACCMSVLGGIQPGRLRSYLVDALKDGPANDGLIQRFQLLVWPDPSDWSYVDRPADAASEQIAARVFRELLNLDPQDPVRFRFASGAQELFIDWLAVLEIKVRGTELHPALISHLSKYRSLMPSLALLFELADRASFEGFDGSQLTGASNFVSLEHARQAAAFCEYLESHAGRVYSCVVTPQVRAASELAEKIKQRRVGADGFFSCRDVYLKGWSGLDSREAVKRAAEILKDAGWLREMPSETGPLGGRPSDRYQVNPRLWE